MIIFSDIPCATSSDIKKFGYKEWIDFTILTVIAIAFCQSYKGLEKFCLGHKNEGLRNRRGLVAVRANEKSKEELI